MPLSRLIENAAPMSLYEAFRAAAFIACFTSTQVPAGVPHALHDIIISLVGSSGISNLPPHLPHSILLTKVSAVRIRNVTQWMLIRATRRTAKSAK